MTIIIIAMKSLLSQMLSTIHMFSVNEINYFSILLIQLQSIVYIQFVYSFQQKFRDKFFEMIPKRSAQKTLIT